MIEYGNVTFISELMIDSQIGRNRPVGVVGDAEVVTTCVFFL